MNPPKTYDQLVAENEQLRLRLEETTETILAIRTGQVDALVVEGEHGHELYTLKTADQTYRVFIETMHEGAVTLDEQGLILYSNSTFASMVGQPLPSVVGSGFDHYIIPGYESAYAEFFAQSWQASGKAEIAIGQPDQALICLLSATPLVLDEGNCLSLIITDLTVQKQTQAQLKSSNEALALANEALNRSNDNLQRFAYVASHDLQEPLRKIQQFGSLLKNRFAAMPDEELAYLDRMQSAASRMSTLIKDLLDYSRISSHRSTTQPVALNEVVDRALTTLELIIAETEAVIHVEPLPTISGDAAQLDQLFQNLLSNALKFRQKSLPPVIRVGYQEIPGVQLPLVVKPTRLTESYHRINVTDNGVGFDEKYLHRIFQVFQRLYGKSEYAGTGIGLAICEKVAADHGGAITATSQPGQGATFSVYFPV
ncbi:sensor histidine kinase [Spirosoma koreense]